MRVHNCTNVRSAATVALNPNQLCPYCGFSPITLADIPDTSAKRELAHIANRHGSNEWLDQAVGNDV